MIIPNWDNTPRSGDRGVVFMNQNVQDYYLLLKDAIEKVSERGEQERLVFHKSWNEWAESNYLEPEQEHGLAYL